MKPQKQTSLLLGGMKNAARISVRGFDSLHGKEGISGAAGGCEANSGGSPADQNRESHASYSSIRIKAI
ncbi:hypothetical protein [Compostibacter hankyongensis]|uniref:hypothetical protein n=1 Tax=Compostibacter hankyongensis TaxID=1007089 RepID=UPI0031EE0B21